MVSVLVNNGFVQKQTRQALEEAISDKLSEIGINEFELEDEQHEIRVEFHDAAEANDSVDAYIYTPEEYEAAKKEFDEEEIDEDGYGDSFSKIADLDIKLVEFFEFGEEDWTVIGRLIFADYI